MKIVYVNYVINLEYVSQKPFQRLSHKAQLSRHLYQHSLVLFEGTSPTSIFHSDSDGKLPAYIHRVKAQPTKHKEKNHHNAVLLHSVISKLYDESTYRGNTQRVMCMCSYRGVPYR